MVMAQYFFVAADSAVSTMFWLVGMGVLGFVLVGAVLWGIAYMILHLVRKSTGKDEQTDDVEYAEE